MKRLSENQIGRSSRKLAKEFSVNHQTIINNLNKMGLNYRKRQKTPKYTVSQAKKSKKLSRKLVNKLYTENPVVEIDILNLKKKFKDQTIQ